MASFVVTTQASPEAQRFYLRGTIWTADPARAVICDSEATAQSALDKARKFMPPAVYKRAKVEPKT